MFVQAFGSYRKIGRNLAAVLWRDGDFDGGVLLGGIWWIINRRIELEKQSKRLGVEPDNDEGDEV